MLTFEQRTGPQLDVRYPDRAVAQWWRDAKLGIFVHWGIYSVPAWATPTEPESSSERDAYIHHHYAEWYANTRRIEGSPTHRHHHRTYGAQVDYDALLQHWRAEDFDAAAFGARCAGWGARYVIPTAKTSRRTVPVGHRHHVLLDAHRRSPAQSPG